MKPVINLLRLSRFPIYHQLVLEEALLRGTAQNWCIINDGAFSPAIVMGISGKPSELIHERAALLAGVQVIKRFTGGGTVVVDHDTIFTSLIVQGADLQPSLDPYPQPIMKWTEGLYGSVFGKYGEFRLRENDYVFNERKFGGNAQSITGRRWLHHTSFLWDFQQQAMALLKHPPRAPKYREGRGHEDFIVRLRDFIPHRDGLLESIARAPAIAGFDVQEASLADASSALQSGQLCGTRIVHLEESEFSPAAASGPSPVAGGDK